MTPEQILNSARNARNVLSLAIRNDYFCHESSDDHDSLEEAGGVLDDLRQAINALEQNSLPEATARLLAALDFMQEQRDENGDIYRAQTEIDLARAAVERALKA